MRIVFVLFSSLLTFVLSAQTSLYQADLAALRAAVEKTASYRGQIKGDRQSEYNALYARLAADTVSDVNSFRYFHNLAQLLFPLRDNHLAFYRIPELSIFRSRESIDSFIGTREFLDYPAYDINVDSLEISLAGKPEESVEGIYHYDRYYTVGVFRNGDREYIGVIVKSETGLWRKGQVAIHLYESAPGLYRAIYGHPLFKNFMFHPVEKYRNLSLLNAYFYQSYSEGIYCKRMRQVDYVNLSKDAPRFAFGSLGDDVQYMRIQTFQANAATARNSGQFFDSIRHLLKAGHLILDLRNNEGGAEKEKKKYLGLLRKYVRKGYLYVLVNNGTMSQAEIFTLDLKRLRNVKVLGQGTRGMLGYGSNYGKRLKLPSGRFEFYPTDMDNGPALLQYEDYGINPDITLAEDRDWIQQVLEIIRKK